MVRVGQLGYKYLLKAEWGSKIRQDCSTARPSGTGSLLRGTEPDKVRLRHQPHVGGMGMQKIERGRVFRF